MSKHRILIVCPDAAGLALLTSMLKSLGHDIEEAPNDRVAVRLMERSPIDLVLASVDPGDGDCLELLNYVRRKHADSPVVLMFPRVHPDRAKEALRHGAMAVLKYPVPAAASFARRFFRPLSSVRIALDTRRPATPPGTPVTTPASGEGRRVRRSRPVTSLRRLRPLGRGGLRRTRRSHPTLLFRRPRPLVMERPRRIHRPPRRRLLPPCRRRRSAREASSGPIRASSRFWCWPAPCRPGTPPSCSSASPERASRSWRVICTWAPGTATVHS